MELNLPKETINELPETITAYKVVVSNTEKEWYEPIYFSWTCTYREGLNIADTRSECESYKKVRKYLIFSKKEENYYNSGFHFWERERDAWEYKKSMIKHGSERRWLKVIKCEIKRKDITAVGKQPVYGKGLVIVAERATFPKYEL
jgi:hypothetical protein